jgi:hypothetical protein
MLAAAGQLYIHGFFPLQQTTMNHQHWQQGASRSVRVLLVCAF